VSTAAWATIAFVAFVVLVTLRAATAELTWDRASRPHVALRALDGAAVVVGLLLALLLGARVLAVLPT
jgi:hypothetical protein